MGPRSGLDRCEKSPPPTGIRSPDRPARSQSLYQLSYSSPLKYWMVDKKIRHLSLHWLIDRQNKFIEFTTDRFIK